MAPISQSPFNGGQETDDLKVQAYRLMRVEQLVEKIADDIQAIKLAQAKAPQGPTRAGMCVDHERSIEEMQAKLDSLTALVERGRGAWWLASILAAVLSFLSTFIGFSIYDKNHDKPVPNSYQTTNHQ